MPPVPAEPRADAGTPLALRCLLAVRLPFLTVTLFAYLIGLGTAVRDGHALPAASLAGLLLALICHAAVNVINDWADARNGSDAANTERLSGYTLVTLGAAYQLAPEWRIEGRLANALDQDYEQIRGYNTPERNLFVGIRYQTR